MSARRMSSRPLSIPKPMNATAMTATAVASAPSIVPWTHCAASTSALAPMGVESASVTAQVCWSSMAAVATCDT